MYTTIENFFISWLNFRKSRCNNLIVSENPNFKRWSLSHLNYHIVLVYFFFYKPSENWMEIVIYVAHDHFFVILFLLCPRKMKYEWTFLCRKILFPFHLYLKILFAHANIFFTFSIVENISQMCIFPNISLLFTMKNISMTQLIVVKLSKNISVYGVL